MDATKTIHAPYCQGNAVVFGGNGGQQCVQMRLCSLINIVICCGSKSSNKLLFSRFQLIDSCHGDSSIKGQDFTEVIMLS